MSTALTMTMSAEVRAPALEAIVDAAAEPIRAEVQYLRVLLGAIETAVGLIARGEPVPDLPPIQTRFEHVWCCKLCGRRIGVVDQREDVLYLKHKDLYVRLHAGAGGWVETLCLNCGFPNRADDVPG